MKPNRASSRLMLQIMLETLIALFTSGSILAFSPGAEPGEAVIDYIYVDGFEPAVDCSEVLACPIPTAGKSCVSGQLTSAQSGAPLRAFLNAQQVCGVGAIGGPCNLTLTLHDALDFASNPTGSTPLMSDGKIIDGCGRFRFTGITPPAFGILAIVVDDVNPAPESNLNAPVAVMQPLSANVRIDGVNVIAARNETVNLWTQSAGSPFGASSFVDVGAVLLQFGVDAIPSVGVTVTLNASIAANKDYYFSDVAPAQRTQVDGALTATGVNGAALVANGGLLNYSGTGGEPPGCTWPSVIATSIPGVLVFVTISC